MEIQEGTRVLAITHSEEGKVFVIGSGVYAGEHVHPDIGIPNPRIDLDNGKTVWGCECWWGPEDEMKCNLINVEWVDVDIDELRIQHRSRL